MPEPLALLCCTHHRSTMERLIAEGSLPDVRLRVFPSPPACAGQDWEYFRPHLEACREDSNGVLLLGGSCASGLAAKPNDLAGCSVLSGKHCTSWYVDWDQLTALRQSGAYVVTAGWLARWRQHLEDWGFDRPTAIEFFNESFSRLVLLDDGVEPEAGADLAAFAEHLQLPAEVLTVGLAPVRTFLVRALNEAQRLVVEAQRLVVEARLERQRAETAQANTRASNYAMAADLVTRFASASSEAEVVDLAMETMGMLFAPSRVTYLPVVDGLPGPPKQHGKTSEDRDTLMRRMFGLGEEHQWTPSGTGFTLRINARDQTLGVLEAEGIVYPERRDDYLGPALNIARGCGLAIATLRSTEALRESNDHLLLAMQAARMGTFEWNVLQDRVLWSAEVLQLFGTSADKVGNNWAAYLEFIPQVARDDVRETIRRFMSTAQDLDVLHFEHPIIKGDGQPAWLEMRSRSYSHKGHPIRFSGVLVDISERKYAEERRAKLEEQLHQSRKMEAIGRLAGGVAHDFNNVLCAISMNAEMTLGELEELRERDGELGQELGLVHESVDEIRIAAKRASDLTRQLLAFSRKQLIEPKVIDLGLLLENLRGMLARLIGENITLRTAPQRPHGRVLADASQLEQIVLNLAINARDAMPNGGDLHIETTDVALDEEYCARFPNLSAGHYVMLAVTDTGQGMDAETRERIFEPFFTTKEMGRGTGLGLATVFGIVEQNKGRIEVYSEPGHGTTFKVYWPTVDEVEQPAAAKALEPFGGTETILVAEDEEMVRRVAVKVLERHGYTVLAAESGEEALELAAKHGAIELLLTDLIMPNMNGRELAERLCALRPEIKVLFTSGYTQDLIAHHGVLDEGVQFLPKPYTLEALAARVRAVLDRER